MEFNKLTFDCMDTLRPYFTENHGRLCDGTVGGTFIWRDYHRSEYALEDGIFYLKVEYPEVSYALPRGKAIDKAAYDKIIEQCALEGIPALLCAVAEKDVTTLTGMYPNSEIRTDRSCSDYLYLSSDLVGLAGRKYSGQRNHINRFTREHQTWSFEHITPANLSAVREYYKKYALEHYKDAPAYLEGDRKAMEVLDNLEAYEIFGGALYVGDEIIGVSFGEIMGDTLFVHAEKADTEHHGAYPMLMNQFAAAFTSEDVIYINREEDDGDEGLRTSKLSYHPTEILHKYTIELK